MEGILPMTLKFPNPKDLRNELILLLQLQMSAVEKQAFGVLTTADILLYERRQDRICELYDEVLSRHAAKA